MANVADWKKKKKKAGCVWPYIKQSYSFHFKVDDFP